MPANRMKEINDRKLEIRSSLQGTGEVDIEALKTELEKLDKEETEIRSRQEIAGKINIGDITGNLVDKPEVRNQDKTNDTDSEEYRSAFQEYVQTGTMPEEFRDAAVTTNNAAVIPPTVLNKIIEKMESYGNILPLVSKTAFAAGLSIPVANMGITASWLAERKTAGIQGAATTSITFGGYKLQARVGVSLEMHVKSLSAFETALISNVSKAMVKALEAAIIAGDGVGKPKGIITETVDADRELELAKLDYKALIATEAAIPTAYDSTGVYVMSKKTFLSYAGMTDSNGQPISAVNMGIAGKPERVLLGRQVVLTENLPSYEAAAAGAVFAFVFDFSNYILNTGYDITVKQYEDNDTDDIVTKATMIVDGKVVDSAGLVLLKKPKA